MNPTCIRVSAFDIHEHIGNNYLLSYLSSRKSFDPGNQTILLTKLEKYGIRDKWMDQMKGYFTNRY